MRGSRRNQGFTLIELMIVVAIVGILASVALPQYQIYASRSEVNNTLNVARNLQLQVGEFVARFSRLPADCAELNAYSQTSCTSTDHGVDNVHSINIAANGVLVVTMKSAADGVPASIADKSYSMTPVAGGNSLVTWQFAPAGGAPMPAQYLPRND